MTHKQRQYREGIRFNNELMMIGSPLDRYATRVDEFVICGFLKPDRESLNRLFGKAGHQSHDDRRIYSARKERAQRNIADHSEANGFGKFFAKHFRGFGFAEIELGLIFERPVSLDVSLQPGIREI